LFFLHLSFRFNKTLIHQQLIMVFTFWSINLRSHMDYISNSLCLAEESNLSGMAWGCVNEENSHIMVTYSIPNFVCCIYRLIFHVHLFSFCSSWQVFNLNAPVPPANDTDLMKQASQYQNSYSQGFNNQTQHPVEQTDMPPEQLQSGEENLQNPSITILPIVSTSQHVAHGSNHINFVYSLCPA